MEDFGGMLLGSVLSSKNCVNMDERWEDDGYWRAYDHPANELSQPQ
jgi:hypothetical protein